MYFIREEFVTTVAGEYDVIVVGAGPAGCGAAIAAARNGAKTLIVDRYNCLGGMWTIGFMNPLFDYRNKNGIVKELISDLEALGQWGGFWGHSFHYEYMKYILDQKMTKAGVDVLLNTDFVKAIRTDNRAEGIIVQNIEGRKAYLGKMIIDCTGDGNVAADLGCDYEIGDENGYTGCQAMTLMFLVGNIPPKYKDGLMIGDILEACYQKEGKSIPFKVPYLIPVPDSSFGVVQFTHMYEYNPLSAGELTAANAEGRRQMIEGVELLKKHDPDFAGLELIASSAALGVRESRRIVGDYTLTLDDLRTGRKFDDAVASVQFGIDIHNKDGKAQDCRQVKEYQIPYRCLLPRGYENILVAGRCISGTHEAMASYRFTGNCCRMGESAGAIAAHAVKNHIALRDVNVPEVVDLIN